MLCCCDDIGFWWQKKGKHLFMTFFWPPYPLCPGKAMWFLAPLFIYLEFILYQLYLPSLSLVEASSVIVFVFLSMEEKDLGLRRGLRVPPSWLQQPSKCVKRACTKAIWWEKKKIKSWLKSRGCFLKRGSQDLESIPSKGDPKDRRVILLPHWKKKPTQI